MHPSFRVTEPAGPTMVIPAEPCRSPESRIGACTPSLKESVIEISTCDCLRAGPSTRTFSITPLGPTRVTFSSQANCPGWERSLHFVNWLFGPNRRARWPVQRWTCRLEIPKGIFPSPFSSRCCVLKCSKTTCLTTASSCSLFTRLTFLYGLPCFTLAVGLKPASQWLPHRRG